MLPTHPVTAAKLVRHCATAVSAGWAGSGCRAGRTRLRRGSAAEPSGLRPDHLHEALLTAHSDEVSAHLFALCSLLTTGEAPAPPGWGIAACAPPKTAVCAPLRWGTPCGGCKLLCQSVRDDARSTLWPRQFGVGVAKGSEAVIHATRQWIQRSSGRGDHLMLKLDFRNTFDTVSHHTVLREVRAHLPGLTCGATAPRRACCSMATYPRSLQLGVPSALPTWTMPCGTGRAGGRRC